MPLCSGGDASHPISHITALPESLNSKFNATQFVDSLLIPGIAVVSNPIGTGWPALDNGAIHRIPFLAGRYPQNANVSLEVSYRVNTTAGFTYDFRLRNVLNDTTIVTKQDNWTFAYNGTAVMHFGPLFNAGSLTVADFGSGTTLFRAEHKINNPSEFIEMGTVTLVVH